MVGDHSARRTLHPEFREQRRGKCDIRNAECGIGFIDSALRTPHSAFRRATFTVEYAMLAAIVAAALIVMGVQVKRSLMGRWHEVGDTFGHGKQYEPGVTKTTPGQGGPGGGGDPGGGPGNGGENCSCGDWTPLGTCGAGGCDTDQRPHTRVCTPDACLAQSECVNDGTCQPGCGCGNWVVVGNCGKDGCTADSRQRTRACTPNACASQSDCAPDLSCICTCKDSADGTCGADGCAANQYRKKRTCTPSGCQSEQGDCITDATKCPQTMYWCVGQSRCSSGKGCPAGKVCYSTNAECVSQAATNCPCDETKCNKWRPGYCFSDGLCGNGERAHVRTCKGPYCDLHKCVRDPKCFDRNDCIFQWTSYCKWLTDTCKVTALPAGCTTDKCRGNAYELPTRPDSDNRGQWVCPSP